MPWDERQIRAIESGRADLPDTDAVIEIMEAMVGLMREAGVIGRSESKESRYRLLYRVLDAVAGGRLGLEYDSPPRSLRRWASRYEGRQPSLIVDSDVREAFASLQEALDEHEEGRAARSARQRDEGDGTAGKASESVEQSAQSSAPNEHEEPLIAPDAPERDAFLSYSHEDKGVARQLVAELRKCQITCWVDEGELLIGDSLIERITEAIEKAEFFIALVSKHSINSRWCRRELGQAAVTELERESGVKVLPLRVGDVQMPPALKDKFWGRHDPLVDAVGAAAELATSINGHRRRRTGEMPASTEGADGLRGTTSEADIESLLDQLDALLAAEDGRGARRVSFDLAAAMAEHVDAPIQVEIRSGHEREHYVRVRVAPLLWHSWRGDAPPRGPTPHLLRAYLTPHGDVDTRREWVIGSPPDHATPELAAGEWAGDLTELGDVELARFGSEARVLWEALQQATR